MLLLMFAWFVSLALMATVFNRMIPRRAMAKAMIQVQTYRPNPRF